jgi:signal transduction histidine kinase
MKEAPPVWMNEDATPRAARVDGTVELDLWAPGILVLDEGGHVVSANLQARELLSAESPVVLEARVNDLRAGLPLGFAAASEEATVEVPDVGPIVVRSCHVSGVSGEGQVLWLRDGRVSESGMSILQDAARHRAFASLARDWAHDLKGMLHVIRINAALLSRLLQRSPGVVDAPVTKCLEAIPREIERLDRAIEMMFSGRVDEQPTTVDMNRVCEHLRRLIAARAARQRVDLVLELSGGPKEIVGVEDHIQLAILNVLLNVLEPMPEQGRLVVSVDGHADGVTVRVIDTGAGIPPQAHDEGRAGFLTGLQRTGIGLHVARAIVESHHGRIECASNVPRGTSIEINFPSAASTERLRHGPRTHR